MSLTIVKYSSLKVSATCVRESCCSVTSVLYVLVVYMKVVPEPNIVSNRIKAFS